MKNLVIVLRYCVREDSVLPYFGCRWQVGFPAIDIAMVFGRIVAVLFPVRLLATLSAFSCCGHFPNMPGLLGKLVRASLTMYTSSNHFSLNVHGSSC